LPQQQQQKQVAVGNNNCFLPPAIEVNFPAAVATAEPQPIDYSVIRYETKIMTRTELENFKRMHNIQKCDNNTI
jgi:hypothetical protein